MKKICDLKPQRNQHTLRTITIGVISALLSLNPSYATNLVINGSFEEPVLPMTSPILYQIGDDINGWKVVGTAGNDVAVINGSFSQAGLTFSHQEGVQSIDLNGVTNTKTGISQTLLTLPGVLYDLSFYVANVQSSRIWGTTSSIEVLIDNTQLAVATNSAGSTDTLEWKKFSYQFTASSNATLLTFLNLDGPQDNVNQLDDVAVSAASKNDACIATYQLEDSLNIPCVSVPDASGKTFLYQADLVLISLPSSIAFELLDAQQISPSPTDKNNCIATYSIDGTLILPCVTVPNAMGGTDMFKASLALIPSSNPITFKLIGAQQK